MIQERSVIINSSTRTFLEFCLDKTPRWPNIEEGNIFYKRFCMQRPISYCKGIYSSLERIKLDKDFFK
jgi:hypothetical protein